MRWLDLSRNDVVFLLASWPVGYGVWEIFQPAAFIVIGGLFLTLSLWGRFR